MKISTKNVSKLHQKKSCFRNTYGVAIVDVNVENLFIKFDQKLKSSVNG